MKIESFVRPFKDYNVSKEVLGYELVIRHASKLEADMTQSFINNIVIMNDCLSDGIAKFKKLKETDEITTYSAKHVFDILKAIKSGRQI